MKSLNKWQGIGNLGKAPETKTLDSGVKIVNFPLATNESYKDKQGNQVDRTEWHNIVIFGKLAEIAEKYLKKGSMIFIEGKLQTRSWDHEGVKRYMTEINANNFIMLGGNSSPGTGQQAPENDDLPF